jgi:hypothetical protein
MLDNAETLLSGPSHGGDAGEEAYHYHTKVMIKEPHVGGAWEWHQDYGYWYGNGNMFPRMLSAVIALNEVSLEGAEPRPFHALSEGPAFESYVRTLVFMR